MQNKFTQHLKENVFFEKKDKLLVAVSGGVDSMVLTHLLQIGGYNIALAHCNYRLRGAASDLDQKLVQEFAMNHKITCHVKIIETKSLVEGSNSSTQMVAREQRYQFFAELMEEHGYNFTVLAHNADDRIESLLMNVLRGTGFRGFQGMPAVRDEYVRPLLFATKNEIRTYAAEEGVNFREDESNAEISYQRNWIRLRLVPMLKSHDSSIEKKLLLFTQRAANLMHKAEEKVKKEAAGVLSESQDQLVLSKLQDSEIPFTKLRELLNPKGFSSDQIFEVLALVQSESGAIVENESYRILRDRDSLIIEQKNKNAIKPHLSFQMLSTVESLVTKPNIILVDSELVNQDKLEMRKWRVGDRFKPFGMIGWKKLSDFFIDQKLSIIEKENLWILTQGDEIVWVIGMRMDDRFKVTSQTKSILKITALS
jgi:tRNA(Ile)-lysidine synthase